MKKIYYVSTVLIILIVSFLGITYSLEYQEDGIVSFDLIGPSPLYMNVGSDYTEYGVNVTLNGTSVTDKVKIDKIEPKERKNPDILKASRKKRIALGCGQSVEDVNRLLKQFEQMKTMMKQFKNGNLKLPF